MRAIDNYADLFVNISSVNELMQFPIEQKDQKLYLSTKHDRGLDVSFMDSDGNVINYLPNTDDDLTIVLKLKENYTLDIKSHFGAELKTFHDDKLIGRIETLKLTNSDFRINISSNKLKSLMRNDSLHLTIEVKDSHLGYVAAKGVIGIGVKGIDLKERYPGKPQSTIIAVRPNTVSTSDFDNIRMLDDGYTYTWALTEKYKGGFIAFDFVSGLFYISKRPIQNKCNVDGYVNIKLMNINFPVIQEFLAENITIKWLLYALKDVPSKSNGIRLLAYKWLTNINIVTLDGDYDYHITRSDKVQVIAFNPDLSFEIIKTNKDIWVQNNQFYTLIIDNSVYNVYGSNFDISGIDEVNFKDVIANLDNPPDINKLTFLRGRI